MELAATNKTKAIFCTLIVALLSVSAFGQAGLTLGGKFVPKDSIMLFINAGNSAMSGRDKSADLITDPHLWKYEMSPANYDLLPAKEPICVDLHNTIAAPLGGPIMPLLKSLLVLYPKYYFVVMQLSNSAWKLWGNFNSSGNAHIALMTQALILKPNVTIAAYISMLNIVEVEQLDTLNYLQKVVDMVAHVRSDLGLPCLPYIHSGYPVLAADGSENYAITHPQAQSIIRQIAQIPANVLNCTVIPTDSLTICMNCTPTGYYSHYDRNGNVKWGQRTADSIKARNWIPASGCVNIFMNPEHQVQTIHMSNLQKIMFDGTNWSAFDKAGKSFSVYSPNGRSITIASGAAIKNQKLLPGVYFVSTGTR